MAANLKLSTKRLQISKANAMVVAAISTAAFISTFSIVASRSLWAKRSYQGRVITAKEKAVDQLEANVAAVQTLQTAYQEFIHRPENIIGGSSTGDGPKDGDNAKLILDALPSKYDFPALATSLEKILSDKKYTINTINGTDEELVQQDDPSAAPAPVEMPFEIEVTTSYKASKELMDVLEASIRPFVLRRLNISGDDASLAIKIEGVTFYQAEKSLDITTKDIQ